LGYKNCLIPAAQEFIQNFIQNNIPSAQEVAVQAALLSYFYAKSAPVMTRTQAQAGLCLRCYVSASILKACHTIDHLFGSGKSFTYRDLLPFVLNDDGKTLVILDRDRKRQLVVMGDEPPQVSTYPFFSVEVLRTFKPEAQSSLSLDNWTFLRTKQNAELKQFLAEFGFQHLSDWALLNRARPHQLERLSERDRHLVNVFHKVYRRDRRQQKAGSKRCPDPSNEQLQEMLAELQQQNVAIFTASELMPALKQVAVQLRQYDIWSHRVPLEVHDSDTGRDTIRSDLPTSNADEFDLEQQALLMFFHQQLDLALNAAIAQELCDRVAALERSKKYAPLAPQFIPGLQLYYNQGLSLKEIAPMLGMSSWDKARRVLNPGDLLSKVRALTVQRVLDRVLEQAQQKGFATTPPEPNYLRTLAEQVEAIADQEIFQTAVEEMRAGQSRSFNSVYAQQLRVHLNTLMHREQRHD
jgi:DNA-directed RNA polymerase specialized sigma24 family protein